MKRLALIPIAAALVLHSLRYDFVCDDAYISFVYSRNFAEHGQLVFNLGERVEGYTNFLWTLLLGILMKLGVQPQLSARVLGTAFGVATLVVVARLTEKLRGGSSWWDLLAPAFLAASAGFACWCSGGLETQMFTFFVTLGLYGISDDHAALAGGAFGLAALTRPEGVLLFGVAGLYRLLRARLRLGRGEVIYGLTFLAIFAPYFLWRWSYYGWLFPNTFYVKAGGHPPAAYQKAMLQQGLFYAWQWAWQSGALFAAPLALVGVIRRPAFGLLGLLVTAVYLAYAVYVGGDFMGLHRFVMPLFVIAAVLAALGLEHKVGAFLAPLVLGAFVYWQAQYVDRDAFVARADHGIDRPGYLKVYSEDREKIGKALAPSLNTDDFCIVGGVGVQPYHARMRAVDVFGLVSEEIAHKVAPNNPRPGHSKWAPAEMLLRLNPTFVFSCYALHPEPAPKQMPWRCGDVGTWVANGYEPVTLFVPGLREAGEYYTFLKRKDRAWP